jgi:hypothetical protein
MRILSAIDAVEPAFQYTRKFLFEKFAMRRFLKLAAVGMLATLGGSLNFNANFPSNLNHMGSSPAAKIAALAITGTFIGILCIGLIVGLALFYVGSRMQFVLFEMTATRNTTVAPIWRRYGSLTWRWIGLKVLLGLTAIFCVLLGMLPLLPLMIRTGMHGHTLPHFPFMLMFAFIGGAIMIAMFFVLIYYLLWDFVLPVMAMENTSITKSIRRAWQNLSSTPGAVLGFVGMRLVLGMLFGIGMLVAFLICLLVAGIPLGMLGALLYFSLRHAGTAAMILMVLGLTIEGMVMLAWLLLGYVSCAGTMIIFFQAYSLFFYGGRYSLLGDVLEPPVAAAPPTFEPPLPEPSI